MKILILTALYPPLGGSGHDERCRHVVGGLSKRGHRVQVLTSNHRLPSLSMAEDRGICRELYLHPVGNHHDDELGTSYRETLRHEEWNLSTLQDRISRFHPDVVYVWNKQGLSKSLLFSLQAMGIPTVFDIHCNWLEEAAFGADPWFRWWRRNKSKRSRVYQTFLRSFGLANRVFSRIPLGSPEDLDLSRAYVCSHHLKAELVSAELAQAEALPVIYPALDAAGFIEKKDYRPHHRFMWAGRLTEGKAPDLALEAVELLRETGVRVELDYFGLGEPIERKMFRKRIDASSVADAVRMVGIRPGELAQQYPEYDAFIYTGRSKDPFPITPLEAMLAGLPCIIADDGGISEIVEDGKNALLFTSGDARALRDAIKRFLELPDGGQNLAQKIKLDIRRQYSIDKFLTKIETLFQAARLPLAS